MNTSDSVSSTKVLAREKFAENIKNQLGKIPFGEHVKIYCIAENIDWKKH